MGFIDMNVSRTFVPTTSKYIFFQIFEQYAIIVLCTLIGMKIDIIILYRICVCASVVTKIF